MNIAKLRSRLMISMLLGIVVFAGLLAYGDFRHVGDSLKTFRWELLPVILLACPRATRPPRLKKSEKNPITLLLIRLSTRSLGAEEIARRYDVGH